jgi:hypothetical protein
MQHMPRYTWNQLNEFALTAALLLRYTVSNRGHFIVGLAGRAMLDYVLTPRGAPLPRTDLERLADGHDFVESRIYSLIQCKS